MNYNENGVKLTPTERYNQSRINADLALIDEIRNQVVTRVIFVNDVNAEVIKVHDALDAKLGQPINLLTPNQVRGHLNEMRRQQIDYKDRKWAHNRRVTQY